MTILLQTTYPNDLYFMVEHREVLFTNPLYRRQILKGSLVNVDIKRYVLVQGVAVKLKESTGFFFN